MEKIDAPLNIIAKFITQNHVQKFESTIRESNISTPENAQEINQTDVKIHTVEDYQKLEINILLKHLTEMKLHILTQIKNGVFEDAKISR